MKKYDELKMAICLLVDCSCEARSHLQWIYVRLFTVVIGNA